MRIKFPLLGENGGMEERILTAEEAAEYAEFKRTRREAEAALTLKKLIVDASRREFDKNALKSACLLAVKLSAYGVLVSPVNVPSAKKILGGKQVRVICLAGGTGESIPAVKKKEAKWAITGGAGEVRLILCYSALFGGNFSYLKREVKKVRRSNKKIALVLSLEDHSIGEEQISLGVRAAVEGGADGVCVRGEVPLILRAVQCAAGRIRVDCSGVENAEQLRAALRMGASYVMTGDAVTIERELFELVRLTSAVGIPKPAASTPDAPASTRPAPNEPSASHVLSERVSSASSSSVPSAGDRT